MKSVVSFMAGCFAALISSCFFVDLFVLFGWDQPTALSVSGLATAIVNALLVLCTTADSCRSVYRIATRAHLNLGLFVWGFALSAFVGACRAVFADLGLGSSLLNMFLAFAGAVVCPVVLLVAAIRE